MSKTRRSTPQESTTYDPRKDPGFLQPAPHRVCLFHRSSTDQQDVSLARGELTAWATRAGATIVELIEEQASGVARATSRPGLTRLLDLADSGEIDAVACWALDRIGRSTIDVLRTIERLSACGVTFYAVSQNLRIGGEEDAASKLTLTVLSAVASWEHSMIRSRVKLGLAKAKRDGTKLGRPRHDRITIERVVALRDDGKSWASIAHTLGCTVGLARLRYTQRDAATNGSGR